jgi:ActR/RegA family two-component response regulator
MGHEAEPPQGKSMTSIINRRVLLVDDEPNVLTALTRKLGDRFEISTAEGGTAALELLSTTALPFAVVVSDMRMPKMDGAVFLGRVKELSPTSTRLMLTGDSEMKSAIKAVNEGHIFRFLCKPCPSDALVSALEAAAEQHALVTAERDIMERTLSAVVKTLSDVLSLTDPELFKRASLVKGYVTQVVRGLGLEGGWQIEVAAALHTLGLVALPRELVHHAKGLTPLTVEDKKQLAAHPETAHRILAAIPRLEDVALIVAQQASEPEHGAEWVKRGARLLRLAKRLEERVGRGATLLEALETVASAASDEDKQFLDALRAAHSGEMVPRALKARELRPQMVLDEDVKTREGALVLPKGHELSAVLVERLRQFAESRRLDEPIRVRVPAQGSP